MKNIVITGGSTGFGKAMGHEFCKRNHNILIAGRNRQTLLETKQHIQHTTHGYCFIKQCDVTNTEDLASFGNYAQDLFQGKIDHWINNAGVCEGPKSFHNISLDEIEQVVNTNLLAVMVGTKMAQNIRAKNIYAISGHGSSFTKTPDFAIYGASKAAISQFYATIINEQEQEQELHSSFHIIAPGIMKTNLTEKLLNDDKLHKFTKIIIKQIALAPEDVAAKVVPKILAITGNGQTIRPIF